MYGITTGWSKFNIFRNNSMYSCDLGVDGSELQHWNSHTIDISNTVDDKPVYYWKNRTSGIVPTDIGQIILGNCSNITIENLNISNIKVPIRVGFSSNIKIINNNLSQNRVGCYIQSSNNNEITNNICESNKWFGIFISRSNENTVLNNSIPKISEDGDGILVIKSNRNLISNNSCILQDHGIHLEFSKFNTLCNNNVSFNIEYGIFINYSSNGNIIEDNYIFKNNEFGILINNSNNTEIYHNHFTDNLVQANELGVSYNNHWDNGMGEGNYWSDYTGLDNGANKRIKGDGVGDTEIPHLGLDNYPLINKSGWLFPGIPTLFEIDLDSDGLDSDGNYSVKWNPVRGSTGYILERDTVVQFSYPKLVYNGSNQIYFVDQKVNDTYFYRTKAYNNEYESAWSNIVNVTVDLPPNIPLNLTVSVFPEGNALNITWKPNLIDTSEYDLYYKKKSDTLWVRAAVLTHPKHSFNHTKLEDNLEYEYKLLARDGRNQKSSFSKNVTGIPHDSVAPAPPEGFQIVSHLTG
jgi:parallel beta-helix repeat protein